MTEFESALASIQGYYNIKKAERSGVPLINHITEGLKILELLDASDETKAAYCLHPMFQSDQELFTNRRLLFTYSPWLVALIMEYRNIANASLSDMITRGVDGNIDESWVVPVFKTGRKIKTSVLFQVNQMLIADKVQNRKDFEIYHKGTHARSMELDFYFKEWLKALWVDENHYNYYVEAIS